MLLVLGRAFVLRTSYLFLYRFFLLSQYMNLVYSITQWLLTLFFGPLLAGVYNVIWGVSFWGPWGGVAIYFIVLLVSVVISTPSLMVHLFFNWLFYYRQFHPWFIKAGLTVLAVMLILVSLVGFMDFDIDDSLVIGYGLAAVISGMFLPVTEN